MTKLRTFGVAIGVSFFCVTAAQSTPLAPLEWVITLGFGVIPVIIGSAIRYILRGQKA